MFDCAIVGGGVIGLSLAYVLASQQQRLIVVDRQAVGREASWAGAGILPPTPMTTAIDPYDQLRGMSSRLHAEWASQLLAETGIDTGYRQCGGLYVARTAGESAALTGLAEQWRDEGIGIQNVLAILPELEPELARHAGGFRAAWFVPDESQLRNPHHLAALRQACLQRGVTFQEDHEVRSIRAGQGRIEAVETDLEPIRAGMFCFTSGAWTGKILATVGRSIGLIPIRGQMVLFLAQPTLLRHIINDGPRYLVPRIDGRILVGSTEEEVGFDKSNTPDGVAGLIEFALGVLPCLSRDQIERTWAGLRPGTFDGLPYLGRIPELSNGFVAAGHFRSGLYLSPGTAVIMSRLMLDQQVAFDLQPFRIGRG